MTESPILLLVDTDFLLTKVYLGQVFGLSDSDIFDFWFRQKKQCNSIDTSEDQVSPLITMTH
jgi:hypothetical protein